MPTPPIKADTGFTTTDANGYVKTDILQKLNGDSWLAGYATTAAVAAGYQPLVSGVSSTEIGYLDGVTSAIQTQIDGKQPLDADLTSLAGLTWTGTTSYLRSDKTLATLNQAAVAGLTTASSPTFAGATLTSGLSGTTGTFSGALTLGTSGILVGGTNVIEQRNSTNGQQFRVYTSYTDASNYDRFFLDAASSGITYMGLAAAGTQLASTPNASLHIFSRGSTGIIFLRSSGGVYVKNNGASADSDIYCASVFGSGNLQGNTIFVGASGPSIRATTGTVRIAVNNDSAYAPLICAGFTFIPLSSVTLAANGHMSIEMTSNTNGNICYRGSDGTTRRFNFTVA